MTKDQRRAVMVAYLELKVQERDWHGVSDAANDLRELEVEPDEPVTVSQPALPPGIAQRCEYCKWAGVSTQRLTACPACARGIE